MPDVEDKNLQIDFGNPANNKFRLDNYPFYLVDKINHLYGLEMESVLRKHNMERVQWQILLILREKNPSSISELSERSGRKLSTVSRTIERMRNDLMVSTAPRKTDNRVTDVSMNDAGMQALEKVLIVAGKQYEHAMNGYSNIEIQGLHDQLQRILSNLTRSRYD